MSCAEQAGGDASSAEKPAAPAEQVAQIKLANFNELFASRANEPRVQKLLLAAATLRKWQTETRSSNIVRDAMTKLGSDWHVPQKKSGKKRAAADVASDLERELLATAHRLVEKKCPFLGKRSAAKPAREDTSPQSSKRQCKV